MAIVIFWSLRTKIVTTIISTFIYGLQQSIKKELGSLHLTNQRVFIKEKIFKENSLVVLGSTLTNNEPNRSFIQYFWFAPKVSQQYGVQFVELQIQVFVEIVFLKFFQLITIQILYSINDISFHAWYVQLTSNMISQYFFVITLKSGCLFNLNQN